MRHSDENIVVEESCAHCGYLLDGLTPDSLCPECGLSASWSCGGFLIKNHSLAERRQLSRVVRGFLVGLALLLVAGLAEGARAKWAPDLHAGVWLEIVVAALGAVSVIYSVVWLTRRDSHEPAICDDRLARWGARIFGLLTLASPLSLLVLAKDPMALYPVVLMMCLLAASVYFFGRVLRKLARRADAVDIERRLRKTVVAIILEIGGLLAALKVGLLLRYAPPTVTSGTSILWQLSALLAIAALVHLFIFLSHVRKLAHRLQVLAQHSDSPGAPRSLRQSTQGIT